MFENIFRNAIEYTISEKYAVTPFSCEVTFPEEQDGTFTDFDGTMHAIDSELQAHDYRFTGFISNHNAEIHVCGFWEA